MRLTWSMWGDVLKIFALKAGHFRYAVTRKLDASFKASEPRNRQEQLTTVVKISASISYNIIGQCVEPWGDTGSPLAQGGQC